MANILKLVAGSVSAYSTCNFQASDTNSLANGSFAIATNGTPQIDFSTNMDLLAEISGILTMGGTTVAGAYMAFYLLPLNQDASTYADGQAAGATLPAGSYLVTTVGIKVGVTSGSTITFTTPRFLLPRGTAKFAIANQTGAALNAASAPTISYRTTNFNLNG